MTVRALRLLVAMVASGLFATPSAWATTYAVDPDHTTVGFRIRHILSYVRGTFDTVEGTFDYVPNLPAQWKASATIQAASIDTRVAKRDTHLRSNDFLDVEQYPTVTFKSTGVTDATATGAKLQGVLTLHGVEKPVVLDLVIHGVAKDPWGKTRAAFTATTRVNRKDFGVSWNKLLETGQLLVGEEVDIILEVEGIAQE